MDILERIEKKIDASVAINNLQSSMMFAALSAMSAGPDTRGDHLTEVATCVRLAAALTKEYEKI